MARETIDYALAMRQNRRYTDLLRALGCQVESVPADPNLPDCVFIEDTAVVTDRFALLSRSGNADRRAEVPPVKERLGRYRKLFQIEAPGTLDGGDVLQLDSTLYVGVGGRTNAAGFEQLRQLAEIHGYGARRVPLTGCLHLKTAVTAVAPGTLLINPDWVEEGHFPGYAFIRIDPREPFSANALWWGDRVIYSSAHVHTGEKLRLHGIALELIDLTELAKAEAGVTCCSLIFNS
jgi:dimethylargininase